MTKERRLAVEMWQAMREKVRNGEITGGIDMFRAKEKWLAEHDIEWYDGCWFCQYFRKEDDDCYAKEDDDCYDDDWYDGVVEEHGKTSKCPLNHYRPFRCDGRCKSYGTVCRQKYPMEQRLAAVDNIIKALKGEYKE